MKKITAILAIMICMLMLLSGCAASKPEDSKSNDAQSETIADERADTADAQASEQAQVSASALIEPEQLISLEEAEELLDETLMSEKKEQSVVGQKIIFYKAVNENSPKYLQISVTQQAFMPEGSQNTPESQYKAICAAFEAKTVSGLGDEAQIIPSGYQIMCDGYYLTVTSGYAKDDDEVMKLASETAVKNLKALLGK